MKVTKSDLTTGGRGYDMLRIFLSFYVFYVSFCALFMVPALTLIWDSIAIGPWFLQWLVLSFLLSVVIGIVAGLKGAAVLIGRDFRTVHFIRTVRKYLVLTFVAPFALFSALVLLTVFEYLNVLTGLEYLKDEMLWLITIWTVAFGGLAIGIILHFYVSVFTPRTLAKLYFGNASESKDQQGEVAAIREAFKQLREDAESFNLELNTSRFERLLDTRLYEGRDVTGELAKLIRHLSDGDSVVSALRGLGGWREDFLAPAKTKRELAHYLELSGTYAQVLPPVLGAVALRLLQVLLGH